MINLLLKASFVLHIISTMHTMATYTRRYIRVVTNIMLLLYLWNQSMVYYMYFLRRWFWFLLDKPHYRVDYKSLYLLCTTTYNKNTNLQIKKAS